MIEPCPGINFVVGDNGAGKTSVLEAIYLAGRGRTFRHSDAGPMIRQGTDSVTIIVETEEKGSGRRSVLGIRREKRELICRLDGQDVKKRSILAEALPVQWIGSQPQLFLGLGPEVRRRFLDMGLFHVEHSYLGVLTEFQRNLRQRNSAIRQKSAENVRIWDKPLAKSAEVLHRHRARFVEELLPRLLQIHAVWDPEFSLEYRYKPGWNVEKSLEEELAGKIDVDLKVGYTSRGPHRAELELFADGGSAEKKLSRGQQKLLVLALNLALMDLMSAHKRRSSILLIDDLAAELDPANRQRIMSELERRGGQVFLTKIEEDSLKVKSTEAKTFHVEHGELGQ
jgi:DNA replication and repair protein RecF